MSGDYSRKTFKSRHNYSGVLMQQGRVQLDADWNEQIAISLRRQLAQTVDTIGRAVVPMETPDGFKLELNAGVLSIFPGRMYIDGLLAENHGASPTEFYAVLSEERGSEPVLYHKQPYFPNISEIAPLPTSGTGIAYLDVWQREVTYIKQPGLVEPAVGIDTTARWQTVWQVKVLPVETAVAGELECSNQVSAWDNLIAPSAGRLSTGIVESQEEENICLVPTEGGYRALENRLYRVEVHSGGGFDIAKFKWSRHNASIETAVYQISGLNLTVAQSQWDPVRSFKVGDWVEVTDDVREFSNVAGELRLITGVDHAQNIIELESALPLADFPTDANDAPSLDRHTLIRRWDQKNDVDLNTGLITIADEAFYLEDGIQIGFDIDASPALSGDFKTGDYWLFYARSATGKIELLEQAPPRGVHHHYARLAILNFPNDQDDCRIHWPPDFGHSSCCTLTVGDGEASHGQFDSIQEAVNQLPLGGGKICVLPGRYSENISIRGKTNIIISGCESRTTISSREGSDFSNEPVIRIENSENIRVEMLTVKSLQQGEGIFIDQVDQKPDHIEAVTHGFASQLEVNNIVLEKLHISSGHRSAIRCESGDHIIIQDNVIQMRNEEGPWPGIFVVGSDVLVANNSISVLDEKDDSDSSEGSIRNRIGRGGIQVGGASEQVRIINNSIIDGAGDGITLGSLSVAAEDEVPIVRTMASFVLFDDQSRRHGIQPIRIPGVISPEIFNPEVNHLEIRPGLNIEGIFEIDVNGNITKSPAIVSAGDLYNIELSENHIENMGRNGIGVVGFFDLEETDEFISIENLSITHNCIEGCLNSVLPEIDAKLEDDMGYGGIALADVLNLRIHDNDIVKNGGNPFDPVCGVYVLHGEGVEICDNRIVENGGKLDGRSRYKPGPRSGIHLVYAVTPTVSISLGSPLSNAAKLDNLPRQNGVPAAKIHNNIIVHPVGRALTINALGPVIVTDNQLTSRGAIQGADSAKVSTASILNLGLSNELYLQIGSFAQIANKRSNLDSLKSNIKKAGPGSVSFFGSNLDDFKLGRYMANGNVMFANNQVVSDEIDTTANKVVSAIRILSLDDISFTSNQCDCSLLGDFIVFPNVFIAPSLRVSNNRFKESFSGAVFSVLALGMMNTTTDNQATHCIISRGLAGMEVVKDNIELFGVLTGGGNESICAKFRSMLPGE
jgi:hypothetical protein